MTAPVSLPIFTAGPLTLRQRLELLRSELRTERNSFVNHWNELADFLMPRRGRFALTDVNRGDRRTKQIIDSTGTFAARTLGAGMHSGMTSPARPWFQYGVRDPKLNELPVVKRWLYEASQIVLSVFGKTNLYNVLPQLYEDAGVFGTAAMIHLEDADDISRFETFPIGSYMLGTDAKGRIRLFMREYTMTVQQIIDEFALPGPGGQLDLRNISTQVIALYRSGSKNSRINICHCIMANSLYDAELGHVAPGPKKQFIQAYYEIGESGAPLSWWDGRAEQFLRLDGYDDFPIYGLRWSVTGEDTYGTNCPGMIALGDVKQLQHGEKRGAQALDLLVKPPMKGPTSLRSSKASIITGDITYVDEANDKGGFKPVFEVRPDIDKLELKQDQKRYLIRRAFHEDLFLMVINDTRLQPRTAREIDERREEKLLALGPVVERVTYDVLDPLTTRQFNICLRKGMFPPIPEPLRNSELTIDYISLMATAQRMIGLGSADRFMASVIQVATAQPDVLDNLNIDEVVQSYAEMTGVPPKWLRDPAEVARIREARQRQAQAAQGAQIAKDAGAAAASLASAETRAPNALTDLLATSAAPGARQVS